MYPTSLRDLQRHAPQFVECLFLHSGPTIVDKRHSSPISSSSSMSGDPTGLTEVVSSTPASDSDFSVVLPSIAKQLVSTLILFNAITHQEEIRE